MANDAGSRLYASAVAALVAETVTLPTDVIKTRIQVSHCRLGVLSGLQNMVRDEGLHSLWKGLGPALLRQVSYTSLSLVLYEPIRDALSFPGTDMSFAQRLCAGGSAGAISIALFNWTEVIKTQKQTSTSTLSIASIVRKVWRAGGVRGFWAGVQPNVARTFLVNAAELGTYDHAKQMLVPYLGDTLGNHIGASLVAGLASAATSTPADVVKTRLMNQAGTSNQGVVSTLRAIHYDGGYAAFYKGFIPIVIRKVAWTSCFFVLYEQGRLRLQASAS